MGGMADNIELVYGGLEPPRYHRIKEHHMTDVAIRDPETRGAVAAYEGYAREQVDLIKRTVAKDATDDELKLFLYQAKRTGLDPLARQIHFTKRKSRDGEARVAIIVAIDGYRLIAERTGLYVGNDKPEYEYDDHGNLVGATVTVRKFMFNQAWGFTATAWWDEYAPDGNGGFMWKKMPRLMLAKVAEALALRKAFPADLSGIYTEDEMAQAADPGTKRPVTVTTDGEIVEPPKPTNGTAHPEPALIIPAQTRSPYVCKDCGKQITSVRTRAGKEYTAKTIAERSIDDYHKQLCWDCSLKAHEAKRQAELAMAAPLPPMADDDIEEPVPA
jgi:phage recombination protein Bet